jgi:hypothetical protein
LDSLQKTKPANTEMLILYLRQNDLFQTCTCGVAVRRPSLTLGRGGRLLFVGNGDGVHDLDVVGGGDGSSFCRCRLLRAGGFCLWSRGGSRGSSLGQSRTPGITLQLAKWETQSCGGKRTKSMLRQLYQFGCSCKRVPHCNC